jgi:hypothetical protein
LKAASLFPTIRPLLFLPLLMATAALRADEPGPTLKELLKQAFEEPERVAFWNLLHEMGRHAGRVTDRSTYLVVVSWFPDKLRDKDSYCILRYTVTDIGNSHNRRIAIHYGNADAQDGNDATLPTDQLKALRGLLETLPESKEAPPIGRTVLVSFQSDDKWRTETYDAAKLPEEFEKVMAIIGERFETKDRRDQKAK